MTRAILLLVVCAVSLLAASSASADQPAGFGYRTESSSIPLDVVGFFFTGFADAGSNCDDCTVPIAMPFPVDLYGQTYTSADAGANGNLQFTDTNTTYVHTCLPDAAFGAALFPFGADLRTNGTGDHISTKTSGSAPNQLFGITWAEHYFVSSNTAVFGVLFYEDSPRIDVAYFSSADDGTTAVAGVQASGSGPATQFSCNAASLTDNLMVTYIPTAGLAIAKRGAGHGEVTSSKPGIACGTTCSGVFDVPSKVKLTASPKRGSYFAGWSGGGCFGKAPCTVSFDHPTLVKARFEKLCPGYYGDPRHQIAGTRKVDVLVGTNGGDIICGLGGGDTVKGRSGKDLLLGGRGNDTLIGGKGQDIALGGAGTDRCFAEIVDNC